MKVVIEEKTLIEAAPLEVWSYFQDLKQWPEWNSDLTMAEWVSSEPWTKGTVFQFTTISGNRKSVLKPTLLECHAGKDVTWLGKTMTITGRHTFRFNEKDKAKTEVTNSEEFSGFLLPLVSRLINVEEIRETFAQALSALKTQVENSTNASRAPTKI